MPAFLLPAIMAGASALSGLLSNRGNTQTSRGTSTETRDLWNTPQFDPTSLALRDNLIVQMMDRINPASQQGFGELLAQQGLSTINRGSEAASRIAGNMLASRGVRGPMAAWGTYAPEQNRVSQGVNWLNQIPMMMDDRYRQNLSDATNLFRSIPYGQHQTGTSTTNSNQETTGPSNMMGGLVSGLGQSIASTWGYQNQLDQLQRRFPNLSSSNPYTG